MTKPPLPTLALVSVLLCSLLAGCVGGESPADITNPIVPEDPVIAPDDGRFDVLPDPEPAYATRSHALEGSFQFGQTHMIDRNETRNETRIAPSPTIGRNMMVTFTPSAAVPSDKPMFIEAIANGRSLGRYAMRAPEQVPRFVASRLSTVDLAPVSDQTWSALVPAGWGHPDITLIAGYDEVAPLRRTVDAWRVSTPLRHWRLRPP